MNPGLHAMVALHGTGILVTVAYLALVASAKVGKGPRGGDDGDGAEEATGGGPPLRRWVAWARSAYEQWEAGVRRRCCTNHHEQDALHLAPRALYTETGEGSESPGFAPSFPVALSLCVGLGAGFAGAAFCGLLFPSFPSVALPAAAGLAAGVAGVYHAESVHGAKVTVAIVLATAGVAGVTGMVAASLDARVGWSSWAVAAAVAPAAAAFGTVAVSQKRGTSFNALETPGEVARRRRPLWWVTRPLVTCAVSGSLVFQQCFVELLFLEHAVWTHTLYESSRGFLAASLARTLATAAAAGHVHAYLSLAANVHHFAWTAFGAGAAVAIPFEALAVLKVLGSPAFAHATVRGRLAAALAMTIAGAGLGLASGAASLVSSRALVRRAYGATASSEEKVK